MKVNLHVTDSQKQLPGNVNLCQISTYCYEESEHHTRPIRSSLAFGGHIFGGFSKHCSRSNIQIISYIIPHVTLYVPVIPDLI